MPVSLPSTTTPSTFITKLASLSSRHVDTDPMQDRITRSTGFKEKPAAARNNPSSDASKADDVFGGMGEDKGVKRDGRLAIIEKLIPGPYTHTPPFDDPNFEQYEPHSTIRLSCVSPLTR
jgi:minichromosome maintenance protein 10